MEKFISLILKRRWLVATVFLLICAFGVYAWKQLAIDAYPDIADTTVQVVTQVPGLAAEEMEQQITIPTGGALLVYTDGITQAEASNGELYGIERLRGQLRNTSKEGCEQILRKLRASVQNFTQGNEQDDDVAAMAIRYLGGR